MKEQKKPHNLSNEELLKRAVGYAGVSRSNRVPRWSHVSNMFGVGSTSGSYICREFGQDPDELVGGCPDCNYSYGHDEFGERVCACDEEENND